MKIKLKSKKNPIKRWDSYGGFGVKISIALNSGEVVEIDKIPEVSKGLVEEVKSKFKNEKSKDSSKEENK